MSVVINSHCLEDNHDNSRLDISRQYFLESSDAQFVLLACTFYMQLPGQMMQVRMEMYLEWSMTSHSAVFVGCAAGLVTSDVARLFPMSYV